MNPAVDSRDAVCVVRQPILDTAGRVFGYELLYRNDPGQTADGDEAEVPVDAEDESQEAQDLARARVIADAVLGLAWRT